MKLDGTENPKPTPFDAHEQVIRAPHTFDAKESYKADPEFEPSEYPKAVAHIDVNGEPVTLQEITDRPETHFEPIVAKDAAHEAELLEQIEDAKEK